MRKLSIKRALVLLAVILVSASLIACNKASDDAVAIVSGEEISLEDFYTDYEVIKGMYESQYGEGILGQKLEEGTENSETIGDRIVDDIIHRLVVEKLIINDVEKRGIEVPEEDIKAKIDSYIEMLGGKENFSSYLKDSGLDEEMFKKDIRNMEIARKHKEVVIDEIKLEEKDVKKFFEENKADLEQVRARHILVEEEEEAKKILDRINKGESFEDLAKENSKDVGSAVNGGDLDYFGKGQMIQEFEDVAFSLKVGEVSDLVKSNYGYHIIKVEDKKDNYESLKEDITEILKEEKYTEELGKLEEKAKIEIFKDRIKLDNTEEVKEEESKE